MKSSALIAWKLRSCSGISGEFEILKKISGFLGSVFSGSGSKIGLLEGIGIEGFESEEWVLKSSGLGNW